MGKQIVYSKKKGFTIMELVVSISLLMVIFGIGGFSFYNQINIFKDRNTYTELLETTRNIQIQSLRGYQCNAQDYSSTKLECLPGNKYKLIINNDGIQVKNDTNITNCFESSDDCFVIFHEGKGCHKDTVCSSSTEILPNPASGSKIKYKIVIPHTAEIIKFMPN